MPTAEIAPALIESRIYVIRGHKVLLDSDLSELYGVQTKALNQAVKRNGQRFPEDFMFRLIPEEIHRLEALRSQTVTLKRRQHRKYAPYVFTEQGIAMLSSVLSSERAILVNIAIVRTFVRLRQILATHTRNWLATSSTICAGNRMDRGSRFRVFLRPCSSRSRLRPRSQSAASDSRPAEPVGNQKLCG